MSKLIYVAGPYSADTDKGRKRNVATAISYGVGLMHKGWTPFIPHLTHYVDKYATEHGTFFPYSHWMQQDDDFLVKCDALFYIGQSLGADVELARAIALGMDVYWDITEVPYADDVVDAGHPRFKEMLDEAWSLHKNKSKDYGSELDPLENLHHPMRGQPWESAINEIGNIALRLRNLCNRLGDTRDPHIVKSLMNALKDNGAYSILTQILMEEEGFSLDASDERD